jgi:hypothetical protein
MNEDVPAADGVSVLIQESDDNDAYFMCLIDVNGKPIAQFGWPLAGWRDFAARILSQVEDFEHFNKSRSK